MSLSSPFGSLTILIIDESSGMQGEYEFMYFGSRVSDLLQTKGVLIGVLCPAQLVCLKHAQSIF